MIRNLVKRAIFSPLQWALMRFGFELRRVRGQRTNTAISTDVAEAIRIVRAHTMLSEARLDSLYGQAAYCETAELSGDFVECGVWKGGAVALMALANLRHGKRRRHLHLFDTFEGIPEPDSEVDGDRAVEEALRYGTGVDGRVVANPQFYDNMGRGVGTVEDNHKLLEDVVGYEPAYVHYHVGFFQETIPLAAREIEAISILRLDGDWFASTKVALDHLYDKVVPGGLILIDDYGAYAGCRRAVDEFLRERRLRPYLHPVDSELRVMVKP